MQTPISSMILRDTSIRNEQSSSSIKDSQTSSYFRGSSFNTTNSGYNSSTFSSRDGDCNSPFLNSSNGSSNLPPFNNQLPSLGSRENNSIILRDTAAIQHTPRVASNRFLSGGLDQRIIKQSTEDCRRLLQQVRIEIIFQLIEMNNKHLMAFFSINRQQLWLIQHATKWRPMFRCHWLNRKFHCIHNNRAAVDTFHITPHRSHLHRQDNIIRFNLNPTIHSAF